MTDAPPTPDTPVTQPPRGAEAVKSFLGDLARPFAMIATSGASAVAIVIVAQKVAGPEAAFFVGALLAGVGGLYWGKAWENKEQAKQSANVAVAQASAPPPVILAAPSLGSDTGELPPSERINL